MVLLPKIVIRVWVSVVCNISVCVIFLFEISCVLSTSRASEDQQFWVTEK